MFTGFNVVGQKDNIRFSVSIGVVSFLILSCCRLESQGLAAQSSRGVVLCFVVVEEDTGIEF